MKTKITLITASLSIFLTASSFTFGPVDDVAFQSEEVQQKEKQAKAVVHVDVNDTKIDTTFEEENAELVHAKMDSILKKLNPEGKKFNRMMIYDRPGRTALLQRGRGFRQFADTLRFYPFDRDSARRIFGKGIMHLDTGRYNSHFLYGNRDEIKLPPMPVMQGFFNIDHQSMRNSFAFGERDEKIISFDRKDIGKGKEKIVIIRKK